MAARFVNAGAARRRRRMASLVGTTGASMILIRPLIRANDNRRHNAHVVVFFIFLVSNIGGSLTPLGDPPLFVGFLRGVDFFWTLRHIWLETLTVAGLTLAVFLAIDIWCYRKEGVTGARSDAGHADAGAARRPQLRAAGWRRRDDPDERGLEARRLVCDPRRHPGAAEPRPQRAPAGSRLPCP